MPVAFDTLAYARRLAGAGVPEEQAAAHAEALVSALGEELIVRRDLEPLATKEDLRRLRDELLDRAEELDLRLEARLEARMEELEQRLGARIDVLEQRLGARIDEVEQRLGARIDEVEQRLGARMDALEQRLDKLEHRVEELERRFGELKIELREMENRLLLRVGAMIVGGFGVLTAAQAWL
ncbi:MAG TPA: hypothetical protein VIS07_11115 [Candidatus Binatia bacterium]